jgi:hypothetical protein
MNALETHVSSGLSRIRLLNLLRLRFPIKYADDLIQGRRAVGPLEGICHPAVEIYLPGVWR